MEINLNKLKGDIDLKNESWFVRINPETAARTYNVLKEHGFDFKNPATVGLSFKNDTILTNTFETGVLSEYLLRDGGIIREKPQGQELFVLGNDLVWNKPEASKDLLVSIDDEIKVIKKKLKKLKIVREYLASRKNA